MSQKKPKLMTSCEVLQGLFENGKSPFSDQFQRWKLWRKWPELVGDLAQHCRPVGFEKGTLYIWAENSAWLQELLFFRDVIKDRVNEFVGRKWVYRVHLTLNDRAVPQLDESDPVIREFLGKK
jgi:hypothetical protein